MFVFRIIFFNLITIFSLYAADEEMDVLLGKMPDPLPYVHRFVFYRFDSDDRNITDLVEQLNEKETYAAAKNALFSHAKSGDWWAISFLFDKEIDEEMGGNYQRLYPKKSAKDLLLKDFQADGYNENAYEYYLYTIRPYKEELAPAFRQALKAGFRKENIIDNIFSQLFNDINELSNGINRETWIRCFKNLQCLGYKKGVLDEIINPFLEH